VQVQFRLRTGWDEIGHTAMMTGSAPFVGRAHGGL
jgi:hypothetical protein